MNVESKGILDARSVNGVPKLTSLVHISLISSLHSCLKKQLFMTINFGRQAVLHYYYFFGRTSLVCSILALTTQVESSNTKEHQNG
jgi:hypothetical protein